jgi:two-component system, NarL family, response regulator LiaR
MRPPASAAAPIRVFVVDDHPVARSGVAAMLRTADDLLMVGETDSGARAAELAGMARADVVLMDLLMPQVDGVEAAALLLRRSPQVRVIMMTSCASVAEAQRAIDAGASGYLLKTASAHELVEAVRAVHQGRSRLAPELDGALGAGTRLPAPGADLTARERQVLEAMVRGLANQQIADETEVTLPTVKFHITNILSKLHVESRTQAVLQALRFRIVDSP